MASVSSKSKRKDSGTCMPCVAWKPSRSKATPGCSRCGTRQRVSEGSQSRWPGSATTNNRASLAPSQSSSSSQQTADIFNDFDWLSVTSDMSLGPFDASTNNNGDLDWDQLIAPLNTAPSQPVQQKTGDGFNAHQRYGSGIPSSWDDLNNPFENDTTMFDAPIENIFDTQPGGFDVNFFAENSSSNSSSVDCPASGAKNCLTTALGFLMQTSPTAPTGCTLTGNGKLLGSHGSAYKHPTSKSVIMENRRIIESLQSILDCPCSLDDDYLLALVALNALKLVSWYTKIARSTLPQDSNLQRSATNPHRRSNGRDETSPSGNTSSRAGYDQSGSAAQTVLSELHRIRRLIYNWTKRVSGLRNLPQSRPGSTAGSVQGKPTGTHPSGLGGIPPLSGNSFDQLQDDLWAALSTVSAETIDTLRRRSA